MTTIELEEKIIDLQNQLKKYTKKEFSLDRLTKLLEWKLSELNLIDKDILDKEVIIENQSKIISDNDIIIESSNKEIVSLIDKKIDLEKKVSESSNYIWILDIQIKEKEDYIKELVLNADTIINKQKQTEKEEKTKSEVGLNRIKNKIVEENNIIEKVKKDTEKNKILYNETKDILKEQSKKIQAKTGIIQELYEKEELLIRKTDKLREEIELMLKEWELIAKNKKVVQSWTTRLEKINKEFIL